MTRPKIQSLPTTVLIATAVLALVLSYAGVATAGYADSAHGNTSYGVNRSTAACENWLGGVCSIGSCAHCHDTFDDSICGVNRLMFFKANDPAKQTRGFCIACHGGTGANPSVQYGGVTNYDYTTRRGGYASTCPTTVRESFTYIKNDTAEPKSNCGADNGSAHFLYDVKQFLKNELGWPSVGVNPCLGCHNPHVAKKDWPCSLPSGYENLNTWEVWGDDPDEKMSSFTEVYQPPKAGATYEWDNASEAPNYVELCMNCHDRNITRTRGDFTLGYELFSVNLGNVHLQGHSGNHSFGSLKEPYGPEHGYDSNTNFILMCTDCHEPHGSPNFMLLRKGVNNAPAVHDNIDEYGDNVDIFYWCSACHQINPQHGSGSPPLACFGCHNHWVP
jgi:hypothetical protein